MTSNDNVNYQVNLLYFLYFYNQRNKLFIDINETWLQMYKLCYIYVKYVKIAK